MPKLFICWKHYVKSYFLYYLFYICKVCKVSYSSFIHNCHNSSFKSQPGSYRIFIGGALFTKYTFFHNFWFNFEQFFNSCIKIFGGALHHLPIITGIFGGALHHVHHLITTGLGNLLFLRNGLGNMFLFNIF